MDFYHYYTTRWKPTPAGLIHIILYIRYNQLLVKAVMGTHSFICYFVTVTVTLLVTAVTNEFLFSSACNEVTEAIGDFKND
jgi:hypothetical protein